MIRVVAIGMPLLALVAVAVPLARDLGDASDVPSLRIVDPARVVLFPAPIRPEWVLEGRPETRAGEFAHSADGLTQVYVWQTTKSRFRWIYDFDETITVVDGEVFIAQDGGPERRLGPGDAAFFPTGARTTWRVPDHLRKIATVKKPLPGVLAGLLRWARAAKGWLKPSSAVAGSAAL